MTNPWPIFKLTLCQVHVLYTTGCQKIRLMYFFMVQISIPTFLHILYNTHHKAKQNGVPKKEKKFSAFARAFTRALAINIHI